MLGGGIKRQTSDCHLVRASSRKSACKTFFWCQFATEFRTHLSARHWKPPCFPGLWATVVTRLSLMLLKRKFLRLKSNPGSFTMENARCWPADRGVGIALSMSCFVGHWWWCINIFIRQKASGNATGSGTKLHAKFEDHYAPKHSKMPCCSREREYHICCHGTCETPWSFWSRMHWRFKDPWAVSNYRKGSVLVH